MGKAATRFYRNNPCCGGAPVWVSPTDPGLYTYSRPDVPNGYIDNLNQQEQDVADAIALLGTEPYPNPDVLYGTGKNSPPHHDLTVKYLEDQRLRTINLTDALNARTGPNTLNMRAVPIGNGRYRAEILLCPQCGPDAMEQFVDDLAGTFTVMEPFLRGVALVVSYVPVFGTIASFVISSGLNLADGKRIDDALLTAVGEALPGQPMAGMAYDAARAVIEGDGIDAVAIKALPDPPATPEIKKVIYIGSQLIQAVAKGEAIADAALDQLSAQLPKNAQDVMSLARNLANGMPASEAAVKALGRQAVDAMQNAAANAAASGKNAVNQYISEAGVQAALDTLPAEWQAGVRAGWTVEIAKKRQDALESAGFTTAESNKSGNDALVSKGLTIIFGKASLNNVLLSTIRNGKTYSRNLRVIDTMSGQPMQVVRTDTITPAWQRGFDVAIGLCEGLSADSPLQQQVRASLTLLQAQQGFDMGQSIQFARTAERKWKMMSLGVMRRPLPSSIASKLTLSPSIAPSKAGTPMAVALGRVHVAPGGNAAAPQTLLISNRAYAAQGAAAAAMSPVIQAARALSPNGNYRWGFDIATALCKGNTIDGPNQIEVRRSLGPTYSNVGPNGEQGSLDAIRGFYAGQHLQFGLTKAASDDTVAAAASNVPPTQAAGALMTAGAIGQGDMAVNSTVGLVSSNAVAKAGAATVIDAKQGFFAKLLAFFGF